MLELSVRADIREKDARKTRSKTQFSEWGHPDPTESIKIVNNDIETIRKLKTPKICKNYKDLCLQILGLIKKHHKTRIEMEDSPFFGQKVLEIYKKQMKIEGEKQKEYFNILRKIGFYDNEEEEMYNLGIITREEMEQLKRDRHRAVLH